MATEAEVVLSGKKDRDKDKLNAALTILAALYNNPGTVGVVVTVVADGTTFSLTGLIDSLETAGIDQNTAHAAILTAFDTAIGATDATVGSIRKAIKDLVTQYEADIAAT